MMMSTTSAIASRMVVNTDSTESLDELGRVVADLAGDALRQRLLTTAGMTSRTAFETSSGLATACLMMPTVIERLAHIAADAALLRGSRARRARRRRASPAGRPPP